MIGEAAGLVSGDDAESTRLVAVLFAADESFSPAQMERDLALPWGRSLPTVPAMKEARAVVMAVAGRFVE